jgi:hypothetical protein
MAGSPAPEPEKARALDPTIGRPAGSQEACLRSATTARRSHADGAPQRSERGSLQAPQKNLGRGEKTARFQVYTEGPKIGPQKAPK